MSRYADSLCETAVTTRGRQREAKTCTAAVKTARESARLASCLIKVLVSRVRHIRPLTAVADIGDVTLLRGGDSHVDLGTPRHVGTHAEEVLELGGRQSCVFVLRQTGSLCQNRGHHHIHGERSRY